MGHGTPPCLCQPNVFPQCRGGGAQDTRRQLVCRSRLRDVQPSCMRFRACGLILRPWSRAGRARNRSNAKRAFRSSALDAYGGRGVRRCSCLTGRRQSVVAPGGASLPRRWGSSVAPICGRWGGLVSAGLDGRRLWASHKGDRPWTGLRWGARSRFVSGPPAAAQEPCRRPLIGCLPRRGGQVHWVRTSASEQALPSPAGRP